MVLSVPIGLGAFGFTVNNWETILWGFSNYAQHVLFFQQHQIDYVDFVTRILMLFCYLPHMFELKVQLGSEQAGWHALCMPTPLWYAWGSFLHLCIGSFNKSILAVDGGIIWKNLLLMYFSGYMGGCSGWLNCSWNTKVICKRFTATICNFIYNWSNLLRNSVFNDKLIYSDVVLFL